jgi:hypothetical protein
MYFVGKGKNDYHSASGSRRELANVGLDLRDLLQDYCVEDIDVLITLSFKYLGLARVLGRHWCG